MQKSFGKANIWLLLLLIFNTAWLGAVYFVLPAVLRFSYFPVVYLIVGGVLALVFVIYNKGFTHRRVKPENLPGNLSAEEKEAWNAEGERLLRRSRWLLTVLVPIVLILFADVLYLFVGQTVAGWFQ